MNRSGRGGFVSAPNRLRGGNLPEKQAVNRASIARTGARRVSDTFPKEGASRRDYGSAAAVPTGAQRRRRRSKLDLFLGRVRKSRNPASKTSR